MQTRLVIFDLDGTILDTLEDLHGSANHALTTGGFPLRTLDQVRHDVGNGIRNLIRRSLPAGTDEESFQQVFSQFRLHYQEHCADLTLPYPGIPELIQTLRRAGLRTAVVSNKTDPAAQSLCARFFPGLFDAVCGEKDGIPKKPAPELVFRVLSDLDVQPGDAVYVGDSEVDVQTAANAGVRCISVDWGFRSRETLEQAGAETIVSSPEALLELLMSP